MMAKVAAKVACLCLWGGGLICSIEVLMCLFLVAGFGVVVIAALCDL